ncbi:MAG: thioredoxin family protein [Deltaproteobacteria bacterium]|nr:thioredoxin family protein [Deltaproteobacteria bacterium]
MKVQVLGPGCQRCDQLHKNAQAAAATLPEGGQAVEVEKVKELDALYKLGVFVTPALVIDGEVVSAGKLLSPEQIKAEIVKRRGA